MKSCQRVLEQIKDTNIVQFLESEIEHCKENKVKIKFSNIEYVPINGVDCSGYFEDDPKPYIRVAVKKPFDEWFPVFIHESCHKDQYVENSIVWAQKIKDYFNASDILDMWINQVVELKPKQLTEVIKQVINLELDCEKRSVEKIKKYNLPINIEAYIQQANSYIFYHHLLAEYRRYPTKAAPYEVKELWTQMPKTFKKNYASISKKTSSLLYRYCW